MLILMGVDSTDDLSVDKWHNIHAGSFCPIGVGVSFRPVADKTVRGLNAKLS